MNVYYGDVYAGQLVELSRGSYEFTYDDAFLSDGNTPPVSVNLPKSQKVYHSERIFPVFTNMLPEGANRRALCRARKVDENDFFGMLAPEACCRRKPRRWLWPRWCRQRRWRWRGR